jgi:hypothetical protein
MTLRRINLIQIIMMTALWFVAYYYPIETFVTAFAVLGPAHYLTEISWLQQRNFFLHTKNMMWPFLLIVLFALSLYQVTHLFNLKELVVLCFFMAIPMVLPWSSWKLLVIIIFLTLLSLVIIGQRNFSG